MSTAIQRSFSTGEVSPSLYARVDVAKYITSLRTCRNFLVKKEGGVDNRAGSGFIGEVKDSSKTIRMIPFIFNAAQTYVLEFGNAYMRVIRNEAYQSDLTLTITGITEADPAVLTYTGTDPANGDEFYVSGVVGDMGQYVNGRNFLVVNVNAGANTFELDLLDGTNVDSTSFGSYTSGGTADRIYTITTPYATADLATLNFIQSADVVTIVHPTYAPQELTRTGHAAWAIAAITFAPAQAAPTSPAVSGTAGSVTFVYHITAVDIETGEESLAVTKSQGSLTLPTADDHTISWTVAANADEYNIYLEENGVPGYLGTAIGTSFVNDGITPDTTDTPPVARNPFNTTDKYPSAVAYIQQRLGFANTNDETEKFWLGRSANFKNFTVSSPLQDDDAVTGNVPGRQVNEILHMLDLDGFLVFTAGGEWKIEGNDAGIVLPTAINPKQKSYYGSTTVPPLIVGNTVLFLQARATIVRDLFNDVIQGYTGNDLTLYSTHLFKNLTITDWGYQQTPNSIIWAVRSDGKLLSLTYIREQKFVAWAIHDFDGATVENVAVVPESNEDAVYVTLKRTVNSKTVRYIERMKTREYDDVIDAVFMDSSLSTDGRHTGATTMTLSGGTTWASTETITLTSSVAAFTDAATDVGNEVWVYDSTGDVIRFSIAAFTSTTVVTGTPHKTVPTTLRTVVADKWSMAVDEFEGLWHLEGKTVSVFADEFVVANPNNDSYTTITVANGKITLARPYVVVHIGLPITADVQTLDLDSTDSETMLNKRKLIAKVNAYVQSSRGVWAGEEEPTADNDFKDELKELKIRETETQDNPIDLETGPIGIKIRASWNRGGRVFIRQSDPIPLSILAIAPEGFIPSFGKG